MARPALPLRSVQRKAAQMKRHLTSTEVAAILGVKPNTLRVWRMRGKGPPYNQPAGKGSQATYDPDVVELFIRSGSRRK